MSTKSSKEELTDHAYQQNDEEMMKQAMCAENKAIAPLRLASLDTWESEPKTRGIY